MQVLPVNVVPYGKRLQFTIEHGPVQIVSIPMKIAWWIFPITFL